MICLHLESVCSPISDPSLAEEAFWKRDWEHEAFRELETHRHKKGLQGYSAFSRKAIKRCQLSLNSSKFKTKKWYKCRISFDSRGRKMNEKSNRNMLLVLLKVSMAGWITSWNQNCRKKYQQPQIGRCYHSNGRKWRGTEEPLDEDERGEWLKTQHSEN